MFVVLLSLYIFVRKYLKMDKKHIKDHLLTAEYGRFDHLPGILPKEVLQLAPPRTVVLHLIAELGVEKKDIPMPALRSWLHNYRKKKGKKIIPAMPSKPDGADGNESTAANGRTFSDTKGAAEKKFDF